MSQGRGMKYNHPQRYINYRSPQRGSRHPHGGTRHFHRRVEQPHRGYMPKCMTNPNTPSFTGMMHGRPHMKIVYSRGRMNHPQHRIGNGQPGVRMDMKHIMNHGGDGVLMHLDPTHMQLKKATHDLMQKPITAKEAVTDDMDHGLKTQPKQPSYPNNHVMHPLGG